MKNLTVICVVALLAPLLLLTPAGCQVLAPDVVEDIEIMKASPGEPPPTSGWAMRRTGPHPAEIQQVFKPGETMMLGLVIKDQLFKREVTFSRFTLFNKETGIEEELKVSPGDLESYETGGIYLLGYPDPWDVPGEDGEYELRLYLGDKVVASALFSVGIRPASWEPEMEILPAPIHEVTVFFEGEQAWAYVKGGLPDSCSEYQGADFHYQNIDVNNTISIEVTMKRPKGAVCAQVYGYFEKHFAIGGEQYIPGETYVIKVNDCTATFVKP